MSRGAARIRLGGATMLLAAAGLSIGACRAGGKNFDNENDDLRRQLATAEAELARITAERNELRAKVNEMAKASAQAGGLSEEAREALPRCAGVRLERLSGPVDDDGAPGFDAVDFYVQPIDGRQRFIPVAGSLSAQATLIPPAGTAEGAPKLLGRVELSPSQMREAYRSSMLGTHYSVRLELDPANQALEGSVVLTVELLDALSAERHRAELISAGK